MTAPGNFVMISLWIIQFEKGTLLCYDIKRRLNYDLIRKLMLQASLLLSFNFYRSKPNGFADQYPIAMLTVGTRKTIEEAAVHSAPKVNAILNHKTFNFRINITHVASRTL